MDSSTIPSINRNNQTSKPFLSTESRISRVKNRLDASAGNLNLQLKKATKSQTFWKMFWTLACIAGFSYQTCEMTHHYFQYPVTTDARVVMEQKFIPPAFSICFDASLMRIPGLFPTGHKCRQVKQVQCNMFDGYSLKEVFFNLTEFIKFKQHGAGSLNMPIKGKRFMKDLMKCTKIQLDLAKLNVSSIKLHEISKMSARMRTLSYVYIHYSKYLKDLNQTSFKQFMSSNEAIIYTHSSSIVARGYELEPLLLKPLRPVVSLMYRSSEIKYLPSPYFSHCSNYENLKDHDQYRHYCIDICFRDKFNNSALSFISYTERSVATTTNIDLKFEKENGNLFREVDLECQKKCPLDCHTLLYTPMLRSEWNQFARPGKILLIIRLNLSPTFKVEFNPKLTTLEYIIYIASGSSLWFGLVVFDFFQFINKQINVYKNKQNSHKTQIIVNKISPKLYVLDHVANSM